jgi:hypothetical protein
VFGACGDGFKAVGSRLQLRCQGRERSSCYEASQQLLMFLRLACIVFHLCGCHVSSSQGSQSESLSGGTGVWCSYPPAQQRHADDHRCLTPAPVQWVTEVPNYRLASQSSANRSLVIRIYGLTNRSRRGSPDPFEARFRSQRTPFPNAEAPANVTDTEQQDPLFAPRPCTRKSRKQ